MPKLTLENVPAGVPAYRHLIELGLSTYPSALAFMRQALDWLDGGELIHEFHGMDPDEFALELVGEIGYTPEEARFVASILVIVDQLCNVGGVEE